MPLYVTSATNATIDVPSLLASRDARQTRQQAWLANYLMPLVSFTVLSPGPIKDSEMTRRIFNLGVRAFRHAVEEAGCEIAHQHCVALPTGPEGFFTVDLSARELKRIAVTLEQASPLGRLWDFDVFTPAGTLLSRRDFSLPARQCLLCLQDAAVCARDRRHPLPELLNAMMQLLEQAEASEGSSF